MNFATLDFPEKEEKYRMFIENVQKTRREANVPPNKMRLTYRNPTG